jgi:hypothetical protein
LTRAARRDRKAGLLRDHRHQPTENPAAGLIRRQVGVLGAAGQQQSGAVAVEHLPRHPPSRQDHLPAQAQQVGRAKAVGQPHRGPYRRKRREQRVDKVRTYPVPGGDLLKPACAVAGRELLDGGGGHPGVAVEERGGVVAEDMCQHMGRVPPAQAVICQVQVAHDGADRDERVERAAPVVDEPRRGGRRGVDRTTRVAAGLEDHHRPSGVSQHVGGHQAVMAGPDDHRIYRDGHGTPVPRPGRRQPKCQPSPRCFIPARRG